MKIYYGIQKYTIDVTDICINKLTQQNIITIPCSDMNRAKLFTDPLVGIHKQIFIEHDGNIIEYNDLTAIKINTLTNIINTDETTQEIINSKIQYVQSKLKLKYGSFNDELPEQKMAIRYLTGNEKVLEIGGNIGRNSLVIGYTLNDSCNFVTLECDVNIAKQLTENRDLNNLNFHIECSALSNRKLIQKNWDTIPSDILQPGYKWVDTITFNNLKSKYNIEFDTLILDCEGAFYYILMDMPEILEHINLIIMENDYWDISKKNYVDDILVQNNFYRDYVECGGWGPCYHNFFEVWKKSS